MPHDARACGPTVLVVEDEELILLSIVWLLTPLGFEVLQASDPQEALELDEARSGPIDLLVADVMLPGLSGPELATLLEERHPELRTLFMSAYRAEELVEVGYLGPDDRSLEKPFGQAELVERIRETLPRPIP